MIFVLNNTKSKARAALLNPSRRFTAVCYHQASNIANASAFGDHPRLSQNPGCQLRNCKCPLCKSLILTSKTALAPRSAAHQVRRASERRYAFPALIVSSKSGSFLNLPASRVHHGSCSACCATVNSDRILRSSRSRAVTRRSNFVAVDGIDQPFWTAEYNNFVIEESSDAARRRRHHQRPGSGLHAERWEEDSKSN